VFDVYTNTPRLGGEKLENTYENRSMSDNCHSRVPRIRVPDQVMFLGFMKHLPNFGPASPGPFFWGCLYSSVRELRICSGVTGQLRFSVKIGSTHCCNSPIDPMRQRARDARSLTTVIVFATEQ
jgi:hypothetical protein